LFKESDRFAQDAWFIPRSIASDAAPPTGVESGDPWLITDEPSQQYGHTIRCTHSDPKPWGGGPLPIGFLDFLAGLNDQSPVDLDQSLWWQKGRIVISRGESPGQWKGR
jgi:hypothetical protein